MQDSPRILDLMRQINHEIRKEHIGVCAQYNLTFPQVKILGDLASAPERQMGYKAIEARLHVAQSTCAGIIKRLEAKGYIETRMDPSDHRAKLVKLTDEGYKVHHHGREVVRQTQEHLLSQLSEAEQDILVGLLKKIRDSFS